MGVLISFKLLKHYPLCMRHLHKTLRREKHLRHYGRLQYGLFLKVRSSEFLMRILTGAGNRA